MMLVQAESIRKLAINILYDGVVADMNHGALNCGVVAGIMKKANPDVNMVSAPVVARERGIQISTTNQDNPVCLMDTSRSRS